MAKRGPPHPHVFFTASLLQGAIEAALTAFEKAFEEPPEPRSSAGTSAARGSRREFLVAAASVARRQSRSKDG
jgi:hypothetical protein